MYLIESFHCILYKKKNICDKIDAGHMQGCMSMAILLASRRQVAAGLVAVMSIGDSYNNHDDDK